MSFGVLVQACKASKRVICTEHGSAVLTTYLSSFITFVQKWDALFQQCVELALEMLR